MLVGVEMGEGAGAGGAALGDAGVVVDARPSRATVSRSVGTRAPCAGRATMDTSASAAAGLRVEHLDTSSSPRLEAGVPVMGQLAVLSADS